MRFTRLARVVRRAVEAAAAAPGPGPAPRLEALGRDWRELGAAGEEAARAEEDLAAFRDRMRALRATAGPAATLDDFSLTQLDLQTIAEAAELDANTMASPVPLRKSDLLSILKAS